MIKAQQGATEPVMNAEWGLGNIVNISQTSLQSSSSHFYILNLPRSRDSSVGIAMGCGLDVCNSIPGMENGFVCTPQRRDRLWGPPSLSNWYRE
jgi:hypothetical protein